VIGPAAENTKVAPFCVDVALLLIVTLLEPTAVTVVFAGIPGPVTFMPTVMPLIKVNALMLFEEFTVLP
jgi:hypothetical protein